MKYFSFYDVPEKKPTEPKKMFEKLERWQRTKNYKRDKGFYYKSFNFKNFDDSFEVKEQSKGEIANTSQLFDIKS